jgi:2-polyprenyl-6-methoxyphenol hydroxylase-like FAD-dependent oxidoreductase
VAGDFDCLCEWRDEGAATTGTQRSAYGVRAAVVIDAHGSWQRGPECAAAAQDPDRDLRQRASDLFAFKSTFARTALSPGVLHLLCLAGGYGGMVVSDRGRTTIACCVRRDTLRQWRARLGGGSAGEAVESAVRGSCSVAAAALRDAHREDSWQTIGPLRTGFHPGGAGGIVRIGNAAAEAQPLIGEGICMALQSAAILARLCANRPKDLHRSYVTDLQRTHAAMCSKEFSGRLRLAQLYARIAMQPCLAATAAALMQSWPQALTLGAQMAGKARRGMVDAAAQKGLA